MRTGLDLSLVVRYQQKKSYSNMAYYLLRAIIHRTAHFLARGPICVVAHDCLWARAEVESKGEGANGQVIICKPVQTVAVLAESAQR
jgi:hypothetical protein